MRFKRRICALLLTAALFFGGAQAESLVEAVEEIQNETLLPEYVETETDAPAQEDAVEAPVVEAPAENAPAENAPAVEAPEANAGTAIASEEQWQEIVAADESAAGAEGYSVTEGLSQDWWNILLMGCDSYTVNSYQRSDSMIIVSLNLTSGEAKLTSLMRDTWVTVSGHSGHIKLTEACVYGGPQMTIRAINENFGMNISDYALVSMAGIADIIDLMGGLDLDVTEAERKALNKGLFDLSSQSGMEKLNESGENVHLNGNQATAFARIRKIDSDYVRTERQRTVLMTLAHKIMDNANITTLLALTTTLLEYVDTNLSFTDLMAIANCALNLDLDSVQQMRIPVDGTFDSGMYSGTWCIKPDFAENTRLLYEYIYGSAAE